MTPPRVAVVIPAMGHPVLVDDAIASAAALLGTGGVARIVVVDDGCRFAETRAALAAWAALLGPRFARLSQPNAGLAAARNAGIALALADPEGAPDAIFLLDADNRLARGAGRAFAELLAAHPEADWFYPPFDFFGQDGHYAGEADPDPLLHALVNYSEAGSLIRARVFAAGLGFDESLRAGYEDWDFFLAAAEAGFRGRAAGRPLLEYRKRPASMLAEAHEQDAALRARLRAARPGLLGLRALLAREAAGFPRCALTAGPDAAAWLASDPAQARAVPAAELERRLMAGLAAPLAQHAPPFVVVLGEPLRDALQAAGLLRGILWNLERAFTRDTTLEALAVEAVAAGDAFGWQAAEAEAVTGPAAILALGPAALARAGRDGIAPDAAALAAAAGRVRLSLPGGLAPALAGDDAAAPAAALLGRLAASRYRPALAQAWDWRAPGGARPRAEAIEAPRLAAGGGVVLPLVGTPGARLEIGFALPILDQGGVEKVVLQLARVLTAAGHACHLFVIGPRPAHLGADAAGVFASVNLFPDPSAGDWAGAEFLGTAEPSWGNPQERADLAGLLRPMDLVINAHAAAVHKVARALTRAGTRVAAHEHLLEISAYGRPYGPPVLALAYEHAVDRILTCSQGLADWLAAHGVPREKLMAVVNAPGYRLDPPEVAAALAARADPAADRGLRVLYLGRLDAQKGIDRVAAIFARLAEAGRGIGFAVAGRAVIGGEAPPAWPAGTHLMGPVEGPAALTAALVAADILVLPSRYEGLPLVLLEAQRVGCVPIATDVGAVREAVRDGETGFVVAEAEAVEATVAHVLALDADRARLAALSRAAAAHSRDWTEAAAPLLAWCEAIAADREAAAAVPGRRIGAERTMPREPDAVGGYDLNT